MTTIRRTLLYLTLLLLPLCAAAQDLNKLWIPDVTATANEQVALPVYVRNTCNDLVGAQFELTLPAGVTLDAASGQTTNRCTDHEVAVSKNGNTWRVILYSPSNAPIQGHQGILFNITVTLGSAFSSGQHYTIGLGHPILSDSEGNNVLTGSECGELIIGPSADFVVTTVTSDKTSLVPGNTMTATWTVANQGHAPSTSGWTEQLTLVSTSDDNQRALLGTFHCTDELAIGSSSTHSQSITLPQLVGLSGTVRLEVKVTPNSDAGEAVEYQNNNSTLGSQQLSLAKRLFLDIPQGIEERNTQLQCRLSRSGNWEANEVYTLKLTGDSRMSAPAKVTIPAGQSGAYFNLTLQDDQQLNPDSVFTLLASGNSYPSCTSLITVKDNELPALTLSASKSNPEEGETVTLTVKRQQATATPVEVTLTSDNPTRVTMPRTVTIDAGQTTATANVTFIDDEEVGDTITIAIAASASGYAPAEQLLIVADNDMPDIGLTLTPTSVSEGAGSNAIVGKVRKLNRKGSKVTIRLSDDSNGRLSYTQRIVLDKDVEEAEFTIGTVDNSNSEGDVTVNVTAAIWLSECSCSAKATSGGHVTQTVTLLDNDGPTLTVTPSATTLLEGSSGHRLTVKRNTSTTSALAVTLSSDGDALLNYSHTVTIASGKTSVDVPLSVLSNSTQGDSHTIAIKASANGFTDGTCWVGISDQSWPDASVATPVLSPASVEAGGEVTISAVVSNNGATPLPALTKVVVITDNNQLVASGFTQEAIAPGGSETFTQTVTMPVGIGAYPLHAVVNPEQTVRELSFLNNTSGKATLTLLPTFTATVTTDKTLYHSGETVKFSGKATGSKAAYADVEVYIINDGLRQTLSARTDGNGNFSTTYTPYTRQAGHFIVGACYPGEGATVGQASFDIYGLRRATSGYITCETTEGHPYTVDIPLSNPGILSLTGVTAEVLSAPEGCNVTVSVANTMAGGQTLPLTVTLTGNEPSTSQSWENVVVRVTTNEGETLNVNLYYYCRAEKGQLSSTTQSITTTMTKGHSRDMEIVIQNIGQGSTGKIMLSVPKNGWLEAVTPVEMAPLASGEQATVTLRLTPSDDLPLNMPITGNIAFNCVNGKGLSVPYNVTPVGETTGTLRIDVCDEYTYNTTEAPHVAGATVWLKNPSTGVMIAEGTTDSDGIFTTELTEGWYNLTVFADKHSSYNNNILIEPGKSYDRIINISYDAVTVDFKVEETEIEDEYEVVTEVTYETNVPEPIIIINAPDKVDTDNLAVGESMLINVILTNQGLITGQQTDLLLPDNFKILTFEPLVTGPWDILPQQSITIPVKITRIPYTPPSNVMAQGPRKVEGYTEVGPEHPCYGTLKAPTFWDCGYDRKYHCYVKTSQMGKCTNASPNINPNYGGFAPGGGYSNNGGSDGNNDVRPDDGPAPPNEKEDEIGILDRITQPWVDSRKEGCRPCENGRFIASINALRLFPMFDVPFQIFDTITDDILWPEENGQTEPAEHDSSNFDYVGFVEEQALEGLSRIKTDEMAKSMTGSVDENGTHWLNFTRDVNYPGKDLVDMYNNCKSIYTSGKEIYQASGEIIDAGIEMYEDLRGIHDSNTAQANGSTFQANGVAPQNKVRRDDLDWVLDYPDLENFSPWDYVDFDNRRMKDVGNWLDDYVQRYLRNNHVLEGTKHVAEKFKGYANAFKKVSKAIKYLKKAYDAIHGIIHACDHLGTEPEETSANSTLFDTEEAGAMAQPDGTRPDDPRRITINYYNTISPKLIMLLNYTNAVINMNKLLWGPEEDWDEVSWLDQERMIDNIDFVNDSFETALLWKPACLSESSFRAFFERRHILQAFGGGNSGGLTPTSEQRARVDEMHSEMHELFYTMANSKSYFNHEGYENMEQFYNTTLAEFSDELQQETKAVCATIKLQFSQKLTMTRQAFTGTLTVFNGNDEKPMTNAKLHLTITNPEGHVATSHEFQITPQALEGFTGELDLLGGWRLEPNTTGVATIQFIPTRYAAETEDVDYSFGGTLTYLDPFTNLEVTKVLQPVTLTVRPTPVLDLTYFMQRDVWGDDPLTPFVTEMSRPAEFALLINNKGYGDANNVKMTTNKPEIVDNEKGLKVDFKLLYSLLNGTEKTLPIDTRTVTDFGTIKAQSSMWAQWYFQSSLLGHFTDYNVTATHLTSQGNADLSLLDQVTIHELIKTLDTPDGKVGFLVNDITDINDTPDILYLTDGSTLPVSRTTSQTVEKRSDTEWMLTVTTASKGWHYGSIIDPAGGLQTLLSVTRESDGASISLNNFWQTDRTLRNGKDPLYEYRVHFADEMLSTTERYILTFEPRPDIRLAIDSITGLPSSGSVAYSPVTAVDVWWNKDVDNTTFGSDDLLLRLQGVELDENLITINKVTPRHYRLDLTQLTKSDGYYTLVVQSATVNDNEGYRGEDGITVGWTQYSEAIVVTYSATPAGLITSTANGMTNEATMEGTLNLGHGDSVTLTAGEVPGYYFAYWTHNGNKVSETATYTFSVTDAAAVVAHYQPIHYQVTIVNRDIQGKVIGAATGIYDYGTELKLDVQTYGTNRFLNWIINDTEEVTTHELTITVDGNLKLETVYALLGDVNYDLTLSITDVMMMVSHVLGRQQLQNTNNADMNDDDIISITDILLLVRAVMQGN